MKNKSISIIEGPLSLKIKKKIPNLENIKFESMNNDQNEVYSKVVRAGKRTYFFDIKATKGNDLYITLTESKKIFGEDGNDNFQKHKIFLYKEDFEKFKDGLVDAIDKISELAETGEYAIESNSDSSDDSLKSFTEVSFEDL